jgi:hypothetical protein
MFVSYHITTWHHNPEHHGLSVTYSITQHLFLDFSFCIHIMNTMDMSYLFKYLLGPSRPEFFDAFVQNMN